MLKFAIEEVNLNYLKVYYALTKTLSIAAGVVDDLEGEWWMIWRGSGG